jgi:multiple sugar transport system substrate-binding protein
MDLTRPFDRRRLITAGLIGGSALALGGPSSLTRALGGPARRAGRHVTGTYEPPAADIEATLRISNWGDPNDQAVYSAVADRFKEAYPNVDINDEFTPITTWSEYVNKVLTQVAGGNVPDIINIAIEGVRLGAAKNLFLPLDDYIAADPDGQALVADVDPALLDGLAVDGSQLLLPSTWNTMLIYYNTAMFESAGIDRPADDWTWDDFLAIAQQLTTGDGGSKVFGFAVPYFNFGLTPWFYSNDTSELNADWTASNLTDPKMVEAVTFVRDLVAEHGVSPEPKGADPYQLFPAGKVAMTGAGHWVVGAFRDAGFVDFDVLPWPQRATKASVYGTAGYAIHPSSENPDLAWEYIKALAGPETQAQWAEIGAATPASRTVAESESFLTPPPEHAELYYAAIEYSKPVAAPTIFNALEPAVMRAMDEILSGTDPAEALQSAHDEVTAAFEAE